MTQNENMSLNPFVRFWGVLVFCFLFLTLSILSLVLFHTEPSVSMQDVNKSSVTIAEIPMIEDLVPQDDSSLPVIAVSFTEEAPKKEVPFFVEDVTDFFGIEVVDSGIVSSSSHKNSGGMVLYQCNW